MFSDLERHSQFVETKNQQHQVLKTSLTENVDPHSDSGEDRVPQHQVESCQGQCRDTLRPPGWVLHTAAAVRELRKNYAKLDIWVGFESGMSQLVHDVSLLLRQAKAQISIVV